jgi:hypothetical protein
MAKLSQADVKARADEYARLDRKISKASDDMNAELEPLLEKLEKDSAVIRKRHEPKIQKLRDTQAAIEQEVLGWLNGAGKPLVLEGDLAIASVESVVGRRMIDVEKFLKAAKGKGAAMWDCVSVAVAKAEKLLGKTEVDKILASDR